jgi:hypothetical protein
MCYFDFGLGLAASCVQVQTYITVIIFRCPMLAETKMLTCGVFTIWPPGLPELRDFLTNLNVMSLISLHWRLGYTSSGHAINSKRTHTR